MAAQPSFERDPYEWLAPDAPGAKNLVRVVSDYLHLYTGGRFELLVDTDHPNSITARDLIAVSMLSVNVPARAAAWLLDPTGARVVTSLLEQIDPAPIWAQPESVITDPDGPLNRLWALLRAPSTQVPDVDQDNGIGPVIAGKLLAAKRPHLVPIYDRVVAGALDAPPGAWWKCWRLSMQNERLRNRIAEVRRDVIPAQPLAEALSDLRMCDIVVWMVEHGMGPPGEAEPDHRERGSR